MNLAHIADLLSLPCHSDLEFDGFSMDSRQIKAGEVFVAVAGDRFDGHDYIQQAVDKGAVAVLCTKPLKGLSVPQFIVADTLESLALLAKAHRLEMSIPVVALTGSNGKTSVKEMIASILPPPSLATRGNLNNHIGVPLSVLQLNTTHRYAVFELGANHLGEIAYTANIVQPDVALINNIAPAHIEGFGSIKGVADAKGEIYQALKPGGTAIVNEDDDYSHYWDELITAKKVLRYSLKGKADIHVKKLSYNPQGQAQFLLVLPDASQEIKLQVPGEHNVYNALAAASCCHALGLSAQCIAEGLERFKGVPGRMAFYPGLHQATVIDDTYNANLRSVLSALKVLSSRPGKRIFVFGDMGELGQWTQPHHEEVGLFARQLGIDQLLTWGQYSEETSKAFAGKGGHYASKDKLAEALIPELDAKTTVLVKGSRSSAMERVVEKIVQP